jgi:hypothetical protein
MTGRRRNAKGRKLTGGENLLKSRRAIITFGETTGIKMIPVEEVASSKSRQHDKHQVQQPLYKAVMIMFWVLLRTTAEGGNTYENHTHRL